MRIRAGVIHGCMRLSPPLRMTCLTSIRSYHEFTILLTIRQLAARREEIVGPSSSAGWVGSCQGGMRLRRGWSSENRAIESSLRMIFFFSPYDSFHNTQPATSGLKRVFAPLLVCLFGSRRGFATSSPERKIDSIYQPRNHSALFVVAGHHLTNARFFFVYLPLTLLHVITRPTPFRNRSTKHCSTKQTPSRTRITLALPDPEPEPRPTMSLEVAKSISVSAYAFGHWRLCSPSHIWRGE